MGFFSCEYDHNVFDLIHFSSVSGIIKILVLYWHSFWLVVLGDCGVSDQMKCDVTGVSEQGGQGGHAPPNVKGGAQNA